MIIEIDIPDLPEQNHFANHFLNVILLHQRPAAYKAHAICSSYIRIVDWLVVNYGYARKNISLFWNEAGDFNIRHFMHASCQLEDCFNSMHRAVWFMKRMRNREDVRAELKELFQERPAFTKDRIARRIKAIRDSIQHAEEMVLDGSIPENSEFMLTPTGREIPHPQPDNPTQTLKVIDRVKIGNNEVLFSEMADWIGEMAQCADKLANYTGYDQRKNDWSGREEDNLFGRKLLNSLRTLAFFIRRPVKVLKFGAQVLRRRSWRDT